MESKDAAQRHASQEPVRPDDEKNTSMLQVHQSSYKGLLRLPEPFAGIQKKPRAAIFTHDIQ